MSRIPFEGTAQVVRRQDNWTKAREMRGVKRDGEWQKRLQKAMNYAKSTPLCLTREERIELACMVPGTEMELESWKDLTTEQLDSLISMLEGWIYVTYLLHQRGEGWPTEDMIGESHGHPRA